jgi:FAD/FMN-containing dehydrogenase
MPMPAMQSMLDGAFPDGARSYWKMAFVKDLPDAAIDVIVEQARGMTSPISSLLIEYYGGAAGRKDGATNAFAQRHSDYSVGFMPQWMDAAEDAAHIAWAKSAWDAIQPFATGGALLNYLAEGEDAAIQEAFGASYPRLREIKKTYDPENFFSQNQNIRPAP